MIIGAQLYSVRNTCDTAEGIRETFKALSAMGYRSVQVSGFPYDAESTRAAADEFGLTIGLTHTSMDDIRFKTDEVIKKHKILGADVVGIGSAGHYFKDNKYLDVDAFVNDFADATKKLNDAGLKLAYHNHYLEFIDLGGYNAMDALYEKTNWNFTLDTGWVDYAGANAVEVIKKFADRLEYVHLKDFTAPNAEGQRTITAMYTGSVPNDAIIPALINAGTVKVAYVEQDNAPDSGDALGQMAISINNLKAKGFAD